MQSFRWKYLSKRLYMMRLEMISNIVIRLLSQKNTLEYLRKLNNNQQWSSECWLIDLDLCHVLIKTDSSKSPLPEQKQKVHLYSALHCNSIIKLELNPRVRRAAFASVRCTYPFDSTDINISKVRPPRLEIVLWIYNDGWERLPHIALGISNITRRQLKSRLIKTPGGNVS